MEMQTKNPRALKVIQTLPSQGYEVLKKGWPDLLAVKDGKLLCVEVKRKQRRPSVKMGLSSHQLGINELLSKVMDYEVRYI